MQTKNALNAEVHLLEEIKLRVELPTEDKPGLDSEAAKHFGRCKTYTSLDHYGDFIETVDNTSELHGWQRFAARTYERAQH